MKLRKTDVETLRSELSGGEVVDLGEASEELVFEDDTDLDAGMATEEISEADTILDDDVEDIGELELEEEDLDFEPEPAASRRTGSLSTGRVVEAEEENEGMGLRAAMILTSGILLLAMPVAIAAASGNVTAIARGIAGIFGEVP
jgi:hypothetical protein